MTVSEMIEKLQKCDPNRKVVAITIDDGNEFDISDMEQSNSMEGEEDVVALFISEVETGE